MPLQWGQDASMQGYYIKDLGIGFGVFKKMDSRLLEDGTEVAGSI